MDFLRQSLYNSPVAGRRAATAISTTTNPALRSGLELTAVLSGGYARAAARPHAGKGRFEDENSHGGIGGGGGLPADGL